MSQGSAAETALEFRRAMEADGIVFRGGIVDDGKIHRVHIEGEGRGKRNGWYVLHADGKPAGAYGSWRAGLSVKWSAQGSKRMSRGDRRDLAAKVKADRGRRADEEEAVFTAAAARAQAIWNAAAPATDDHPYLKRKGVKSHGLRVGTWEKVKHDTGEIYASISNSLLVPIRDARGAIVSLQAIFPEKRGGRDKDFLFGGRKKGCFFTIGKPADIEGLKTVAFGEGYATCATVFEATGIGVFVIFDAGNMVDVASVVRAKFPERRLVFCADDDRWTNSPVTNPGKTRAVEASQAVSEPCVVVLPSFSDLEGRPTDFNDMALREGIEAVKARIMWAVEHKLSMAADPQAEVTKTARERPAPETALRQPGPAVAALAPAQAAPEVNNAESDESLEAHDDRDYSRYFAILGHNRGSAFFFQHEGRQVLEWPLSALMSEGVQFTLADMNWWEREFPGTGRGDNAGHNRKMAGNWLLRTAQRKGIFSSRGKIRSRGAWIDDGRHVYHLGDSLWVDGKIVEVTKIKSRFVYEMVEEMPAPAETRLTDAEGMHLVSVAKMFKWERPVSGLLAAGWVALAPICGVLAWRPHIWVTGEAHCGKSTFVNQYAYPLTNKMASFHQGQSTEAGIRQELERDARPVIIDESESNNERDRHRVSAILTMTRQASSDSEAKTHKGTTGGKSMAFHIRSMFALSSIQVGLEQQADYERFARLSMLKPGGEGDQDRWQVLAEELHKIATDETIGARLMRRVLDLLPITLKNVKTFRIAAGRIFGNQRDGDQYGTLLAGYWSLVNATEARDSDADELINSCDWEEHREATQVSEPTRARTALMRARIRHSSVEMTVHSLVTVAAGGKVPGVDIGAAVAKTVLKGYGMKVQHSHGGRLVDCALLLQNTSEQIPKLLRDTSYAAGWRDQLLRAGAERHERNERFGADVGKCIRLPLQLVLDEVEEDDSVGQAPM
jgi:putative DNA primase/helicase